MNDGGRAFPRSCSDAEGDLGQMWNDSQPGMSLRDYFAAKAMQAFISKPGTINGKNSIEDFEYAQFAYRLADCMITERAKTI